MAEGIRIFAIENILNFVQTAVSANWPFEGEIPWWRGHADRKWSLVPSVYRKGQGVDEQNMAIDFRRGAQVRCASAPDRNDLPGLLFLMRHYGGPTRILDWTLSPLIGLFFAVRDKQLWGCDAALWALSPSRLNKCETNGEQEGIIGVDQKDASTLFRAAFDRERKSVKTLAILACHTDLRQMVQQSEFTIHGSPQPMEEHPDAGQFLARIDIPASAKERLKHSLHLLGIREAVLFPDLEHLAREVASTHFMPRK